MACDMATTGGVFDWRVPTMRELATLVNVRASEPAVDGTAFPGVPAFRDLFCAQRGWALHFNQGTGWTEASLDVDNRWIRCVRGAP